MTSCAWLWLYLGAILMILELLAPGFVVFFFGLSAATVALLRFIFGEAFSSTWQIAAFSLFAVLYLVFLRRVLKSLFAGTSETSSADFEHESVGRTGTVTEPIRPPLAGRAMIGDAEWTAEADVPIEAGAAVTVVAQRNLTMRVKRVES